MTRQEIEKEAAAEEKKIKIVEKKTAEYKDCWGNITVVDVYPKTKKIIVYNKKTHILESSSNVMFQYVFEFSTCELRKMLKSYINEEVINKDGDLAAALKKITKLDSWK